MHPVAASSVDAPVPPFLLGTSAMAAAMRDHDWNSTLGPPSSWPAPLATLAGVMLASEQPMFMAWGPSRTWLYNDAFVPILGRKHPEALGRPALSVWAEARAELEPLFARVFAGQSVHMNDISLGLDRRGVVEESHFSFSYNPVRDEHGAVVGLFGVCIETTDKVLADQRELAAQARQRRMFERAPGFIAILHGPDHLFEFANAAYVRLTGGRPLVGRTVREAFPEVADQGFFDVLDEVYRSGRRYIAAQVPVRLAAATGADPVEHRLDFIYEPILGEDDRVTGIFVEGHDVTEAYRSQQELRAADRRKALLVELTDSLRMLDDPADISYAAAELLGRALGVSRAGYGTVDLASETIAIERDWNAPGIRSLAGVLRFRDYGSYIEDLKRGETVVFADAHADPRTRERAHALAAISALSVVNMPVTEHEGLVALLYLNHATPRAWTPDELAFVREVAERTRTAVERRRAEKDLLALTQSLEQQVAQRTAERDRVWRNSRDLLAVLGADGIVRSVNPAWHAMLGVEPEEVTGRSILERVLPEDVERTRAALAGAAHADNLTNFENRYRHCNGDTRWISWHTAAEGELVYAYGRDITAQKQQAEALQKAEEALRQSQKLEAIGQLTGGVAHDFNNLLSVVANNVYLHRRLSPACRHSAQLAAVVRAAETGARLTRHLLTFARRQPILPEVIGLAQELHELLPMLQVTLGSRIEIALSVDADTPAVKVDRAELELALLNLAVNARDAMPDGGRLSLHASRSLLGSTPAACISVGDTGTGMPPEVLARVLEPFFTTKQPGQGTGLGLSQAYGFATQAGGALDIQSQPGQGTTVRLLLPGSNEAASTGTSSHAAGAARLRACVLLVEDNPDLAAAVRELLESEGCEVLHAATGSAARGILLSGRGRRIDLVLSDLVMPGSFNGLELAQWLEQQRPDLALLLYSGYSREMAQARELGFSVLQKPVDPETLLGEVRKRMPAQA